jgi:ABC-type sugar transport system permease subunit
MGQGTTLRIRARSLIRKSWPAYLLLLPFIAHFIGVVAYPFFYSIYLSFFQAGLNQDPTFVGLDNYARLIGDGEFHQALLNTLYYTVVVVAATMVLPLALAIAMNAKLPGRTLFRVAIFLPVITSQVVVSLIWSILFNESGIVNQLLTAAHLPAQPFLAEGKHAMGIIMGLGTWQGLGYFMIIYLAALQGVPRELVEAAAIDGADRWRSVWHVTLPSIRPVIYFVASIATINSMQLFTQSYIITQGGPLNATLSIVQLLYRHAFVQLEFGYGSAMGTVLLLILVALSAGYKLIHDWAAR